MTAARNTQPTRFADSFFDRSADFRAVRESLGDSVVGESARGIVSLGDSLELIRKIPDKSVSLVLTDPPYHTTKKSNITGDRDFAADEDFLTWMEQYAQEWHRILRPNGAVYLFCAAEMSARLEVVAGRYLRPLNHITWTKPNDPGFDGWKGKAQKEALRRWYPHSERILFFEQAHPEHERRSPLATMLREARAASGLSGHQLTEAVGAYGKVNHGGAVSNWETGRNIPSRDQYEKIVAAIESTGRVSGMPAYEDAVRRFAVSKHVEFTDVWDFPSVRPYQGKHPAEKPVEMLSHAIESSTYPDDLVLDCFCGSGATLDAAINTGRHCIGLEIESRWAEASAKRLARAEEREGKNAEIRITRSSRPADSSSVALS